MFEAEFRLAVFVGLFLSLASLEIVVPRRRLKPVKLNRWITNWAIVIIDSLMVRLVFKAAAVGGALWAEHNGFGLFHMINPPYWIAFVLSFLVLDFAVWLSHLASHKVPLFWRIHRMHHSDVDFDVSTAIRFHPIEILLSMAWKYVVVLVMGAPAAAVLVFEIVLNGGAMFNHSNIKLASWLDGILRILIVTPDMHRVHHSVNTSETNSNYGFNLSIWDRIFKTYIAQPELGHDQMKIGLREWQDERPTRLKWALMIPFSGKGQ